MACNNSVFGDPAPNVPKGCEVDAQIGGTAAGVSGWTRCAAENGTCALDRPATVRYGVEGHYVTRQMNAGSFTCGNAIFGDPAPNVVKACDVQVVGKLIAGQTNKKAPLR